MKKLKLFSIITILYTYLLNSLVTHKIFNYSRLMFYLGVKPAPHKIFYGHFRYLQNYWEFLTIFFLIHFLLKVVIYTPTYKNYQYILRNVKVENLTRK